MTRKAQAKKKPGPAPDRVAIDGNWQEAVEKAVGIEKSPGGSWPKAKKWGAGGKRKRTPKK